MSKKVKTAINPTREENYPAWYQQVIKANEEATLRCQKKLILNYALLEKNSITQSVK